MMNKETKVAVEAALKDAAERLGELEYGSEEYNKTLANVEKLYSAAADAEKSEDQITKDYDVMNSNERIAEERLKEDKRKRRSETIINSVQIGLAAGLTIVTLGIEAGGTTVTQTFRNIYSSTIGKIFKRR